MQRTDRTVQGIACQHADRPWAGRWLASNAAKAPMTSKEGEVFYEATGHLHRYMYNLGMTQPVSDLELPLFPS